MADLKFLQYNKDLYKANLKLRAENKPASRFHWNNAINADGVPILARCKETEIDPNIKVTHNIFVQIMNDKSSYIASNIEIVFSNDISEDVRNKYEDLNKRINLKSFLKNIMESVNGWGNTYILCSLNNDFKVELEEIYSWQAMIDCKTGYGYVYEYDKDSKQMIVYEYDDKMCRKYRCSIGFKRSELVDEQIHGFGKMPLIKFKNNKYEKGNAELAVYLIDAYDRVVADNLTEWSSLRQAYLLLKDVGNVDEAKAKEFKRLAMIIGNSESSDVKFITKNINPDFAKFITQHTWSSIWSTACVPDPNALESLSNVTAFQISQLYRRLDNDCQSTIAEWNKSLQKLDDVLHSYWTSLDLHPISDYSTWDIDYIFHKSIPIDVMTYLKDLRAAGGNLPQEEILIKSGYEQAKAVELTEKYKNEQAAQADAFTNNTI